MKKYVRKLSLWIAVILLVVSIMPDYVSAASKITLKSGAAAPASIYAGHSYTLKVAGTAVKFYSSNKKIATIGVTTGKLKAKAPGTVKITAKSKKTGKSVAAKSFTVLQRATSVAADSSELYLGAVGDTATLKATKTPATSTDIVKFFSADKTIATVGMTSGKVTAKAEGKTTISIYSMATKATAKSNKYNKTATVDVYVGAYMASVVQNSITQCTATFKTDVKSVIAADFTITNDATKVVYPVKEAKISTSDAKQVILTTYADIKDAGDYTVSYGKTSAQFKATDGTVASISITPTSVLVGRETSIYVMEEDANGIEVGKYSQQNLPSNLELSIETNNGYVTFEGKLYLSSNASTAKATAKFHTWKYEDVDGMQVEKGLLTAEATISATVGSDVSSSGIQYTIAKQAPNFASASYKQNTGLCVGDEGYYAYFKITDSSGTEITDYSAYNVTSSNSDVLLVTSSIDTTAKCVSVSPIKAGTANIIVKNSSTNTVVATLSVTVKSERKATTLVLDKSTVTASNSEYMNGDQQNITCSVKDQYGDNMDIMDTSEFTISLISCPSGVDQSIAQQKLYIGERPDQLIFSAYGLNAGNYQYTVQYQSLTAKSLTATVKNSTASGTCGFSVSLSTTSIDAVVTSEADMFKSVIAQPVLTTDGVSRMYLQAGTASNLGITDITEEQVATATSAAVEVTLTNSEGEDVTDQYMDYGYTAFNVVSCADGNLVVAPAGTYTLTYHVEIIDRTENQGTSSFDCTKVITVINTQPAVSYVRVSDTFNGSFALGGDGTITNLDEVLNNCYTFYYDGTAYGKNGIEITGASCEYNYAASGYIAFRTITINVQVEDYLILPIKVEMNNAYTVTSVVAK